LVNLKKINGIFIYEGLPPSECLKRLNSVTT